MKPIDFRNATFDQVQEQVTGGRALVLAAWLVHGPCTTKELAERSHISILTVRPRTTELFELGCVLLAEDQPRKGEGVYRVATEAEHRAWLEHQRQDATSPQRVLALGV